MADVVENGKVVSLSYTLKLANGEVVDYSEADEPLEYLHGAGNIVPGLERELAGLAPGTSKDVEVSAAEGYGPYDANDVEVVDKKMLPKDFPLELGMVVAISDDDGGLSEAYVREITPANVKLDFNHPLAGQVLFFSVQVLGIRDATEEEIEHGHPHDADGNFDDEDDFDEDEDDFDEDEDLLDFLDEDEDEDDLDEEDETEDEDAL